MVESPKLSVIESQQPVSPKLNVIESQQPITPTSRSTLSQLITAVGEFEQIGLRIIMIYIGQPLDNLILAMMV